MEKKWIIIILIIFVGIIILNTCNTKNENYDAGYLQHTTFRDCSRKLFTSYKDVEFLKNNIENDNLTNCINKPCDCNLQYRKVKFTP
jgi:hypothetical protein